MALALPSLLQDHRAPCESWEQAYSPEELAISLLALVLAPVAVSENEMFFGG